MKLKDLGYNNSIHKLRIENNLEDFDIGRVTSEHKERYIVKTEKGEFDAEVTGNLRYTATSREDFPAVGDWVALIVYDSNIAIIHKILTRYSVLSRKSAGQSGERQIIASNIDYALILLAIDRDFNVNRIERYLTICYSSDIQPIIILNKVDLIDETLFNQLISNIQNRIKNAPLFAISNKTRQGIKKLKESITKGKTYCLLGSSGVGKSTLTNILLDKEQMVTDTVSERSNRGKHVTTHRELQITESGGILIDNPGMREVGITDNSGGLEKTFKTLIQFSNLCKFKNCTHTTEVHCAVITAVKNGELDQLSYENYLKMEREKAHYEATIFEKRKKDRQFGKIIKQHLKTKNQNNY